MGAATIETNTRSCPPIHGKAGNLSFPMVYDTPMWLNIGVPNDGQNSCPPDFGLAAPLCPASGGKIF